MSVLILCSRFLLVFIKYVLINYNRLNCAITIQYRFTEFLTLSLHHVAAMYFIPFGNCREVRHLSLKIAKN